MSGKGAKGLIMGKTAAKNDKEKEKKKPTSRSSRAGLQVSFFFSKKYLDFFLILHFLIDCLIYHRKLGFLIRYSFWVCLF